MTIQRGRDWGEHGPLPPGGVVVASDADARLVVERARREGRPLPPLGLVGGDLCRTLGGRGDEQRLFSPEGTRLTVDVGAVLVDERPHWFVAHLVARRSWLRGRIVAVMNAEWLGRWDVAPRAHPADGLLDLLDGSPPLRDRLRARRRLRSATHVPHPEIREQRAARFEIALDPPLGVALDGLEIGPASRLTVWVEPDALTVVV
ncbi:MAG: hypothetical protein IPM45_01360 [Acidimicrobiales bacterium]|nr:hypothetical protein [Acidimicrobiales bacterium]